MIPSISKVKEPNPNHDDEIQLISIFLLKKEGIIRSQKQKSKNKSLRETLLMTDSAVDLA